MEKQKKSGTEENKSNSDIRENINKKIKPLLKSAEIWEIIISGVKTIRGAAEDVNAFDKAIDEVEKYHEEQPISIEIGDLDDKALDFKNSSKFVFVPKKYYKNSKFNKDDIIAQLSKAKSHV